MATEIKEYSEIDEGIAKLAEMYKEVPDCKTDKGLKDCKKQYREIRKVETSLEKTRKALGDEARKHLEKINSEAKSIDSRLKAISAPFKQAFEKRELEIKEAEEKRIADIRLEIDRLHNFCDEAESMSSDQIADIIEAVDLIDISESFEEFTQEALQAKKATLEKLATMMKSAIAFEQSEAERVAAEKAKEEAEKAMEIEKRISNLKMMPIEFMGKPSAEIDQKIHSLSKYQPSEDEFGERYQEACTAQGDVIKQLTDMSAMVKLTEEAKAAEQLDAPAESQSPVDMTDNHSNECPDYVEWIVLSEELQGLTLPQLYKSRTGHEYPGDGAEITIRVMR